MVGREEKKEEGEGRGGEEKKVNKIIQESG
jgi:hypothetical protein